MKIAAKDMNAKIDLFPSNHETHDESNNVGERQKPFDSANNIIKVSTFFSHKYINKVKLRSDIPTCNAINHVRIEHGIEANVDSDHY